jgi:excisionase family DNA binding protein
MVKKTPQLPRTADDLLQENFLTVKEACQVARCSEVTMYSMLGKKLFRAVKMGRKTLIYTESLVKYLNNLPAAKITTGSRDRKVAEPV